MKLCICTPNFIESDDSWLTYRYNHFENGGQSWIFKYLLFWSRDTRFCFLAPNFALFGQTVAEERFYIYYGVNPPSWICKILIFRHVSIFETKIRVFLYQIQSKSDDSRSIYLKKNTFKVAAVRYRRYRPVIAYEIPIERNPVSMWWDAFSFYGFSFGRDFVLMGFPFSGPAFCCRQFVKFLFTSYCILVACADARGVSVFY